MCESELLRLFWTRLSECRFVPEVTERAQEIFEEYAEQSLSQIAALALDTNDPVRAWVGVFLLGERASRGTAEFQSLSHVLIARAWPLVVQEAARAITRITQREQGNG